MTIKTAIKRGVFEHLPPGLKGVAKRFYYKRWGSVHPAFKKLGTVQDLYYWVSDGDLDTLLLLQNYFSALFPELDSDTQGTVSIYDNEGSFIGDKQFTLGRLACARFKVSQLLREFDVPTAGQFGTLEVKIDIPTAVSESVQPLGSYYFWDRFYICYTNSLGHTSFVHGVDKTHIFHEGEENAVDWHQPGASHQWSPEAPVNIDDYTKLEVILINRTSTEAPMTMVLSDSQDASISWSAEIPSKGVHRFELTPESVGDLERKELRIRVEGMTSQYGRPVLFKRFANGAMSAMHC